MSTDHAQALVALGRRLRELRGSLTGREVAVRLRWGQSKVSKLETGRQTPSEGDLAAWADAVGAPAAAEELINRLRILESGSRSWRRQLAAGHRPVQDALTVEYERSRVLRAWQPTMVVGMLQTPDYARHVFERFADLQQCVRDTDTAVRARIQRQEDLYRGRRRYEIVLYEAALHASVCPPNVLAAQLDRLAGVVGLDTVRLGVIPFSTVLRIPPGNPFWLYDDRLAVIEDWHTEVWVDDADHLALYRRVWDTLHASAVHGHQAHRLIARARAHLILT